MTQSPDQTMVERILAKRPVYTVTAGRTGTNYLQLLFTLFPDTLSLHEGEPDFVQLLRRTQQNPDVGYNFCVQTKLPFVAQVKEKRYVETSHLFCKGFVESYLRCGIIPDIVILRRPPREIAKSNLGLGTIPSRTPAGIMYLLAPDDPNVLPMPLWQYMSDYQLCFWYSLEIERRQRYYADMFRTLGSTVIETSLSELLDFGNFVGMASRLGFPASADDAVLKEKFQKLSGIKHNEKRKSPVTATEDQFAAAEEEVWGRIFYYDPLLRGRVEQQYERAADS